MTISRRSLLASSLLAGLAPAIVSAGSIIPITPLDRFRVVMAPFAAADGWILRNVYSDGSCVDISQSSGAVVRTMSPLESSILVARSATEGCDSWYRRSSEFLAQYRMQALQKFWAKCPHVDARLMTRAVRTVVEV